MRMTRRLAFFMAVWGLCVWGSRPVAAQQARDDPYAGAINKIHEASLRGGAVQTSEPAPILKEGPHTLQLHVVSAATGEALRMFQVSLYPREATRSAMGRLSGVVWPSWKTYQDVAGVVSLEGLSKDRWFLMVSSPGYIRHGQVVMVPHEKVLEIALAPKTARLSGRVVDAVTQTPLPGATVTMGYFIGAREGLDGIEDPDFHPVTTGADGIFRLEPLAGEGYGTRVEISHDGYFPENRRLAATAPWKEALGDILLYPHARIDGQVIDATGQPVEDQPVYVLEEEIPYLDPQEVARFFSPKDFARPQYAQMPEAAQRYITNGQGRFSSIPMHAARYRVVYGSLDKHVELIELEYGQNKALRLQKR